MLDPAAAVRVSQQWHLSASIDNVTNRYPGQVTSLANLNVNGTQRHSMWAPNGFNGRFI